jgi:hypothetical protein
MSDKEFLEKIETRVMYAMLSGCEMDSYLGRYKFDPASWAVTLRADELCRLIDLVNIKEN